MDTKKQPGWNGEKHNWVSGHCYAYEHLNVQLNAHCAANTDADTTPQHTSALSRLLTSSLAFAVTKSMLSSLSSALALSTAWDLTDLFASLRTINSID